jgi:hypothetical protein
MAKMKDAYGSAFMAKGDRAEPHAGPSAGGIGHAYPVKKINTMAESSDMGRMQYADQGNRGYPAPAMPYQR